MGKEKTHINIAVIGHVDSVKSTTTGHLRCKSQHVRTRQTMLRSGSAVFPGTAGKHSASAASGLQTSKEDPQRDNWKTLFESLF